MAHAHVEALVLPRVDQGFDVGRGHTGQSAENWIGVAAIFTAGAAPPLW